MGGLQESRSPIFMITDPWFYLVAIPAVALFGLSKGGFAGASLPAMPLLAFVMPPLMAAAVVLPVLIVQDAVTVYAFRKSYDARMLRLLLPGAMFGLAIGWATATTISPGQIRFAVGLVAALFCLNAWFGGQVAGSKPAPHNAASATVWGTISGFTSFIIHAGGAPFSMYALPRQLPKQILAGTSAIFFAVINASKIPAYLALGTMTRETLLLSAALLPAAILTNYGGIYLVRVIPQTLFYRILYVLLFVLALKLMHDGWSDVFGFLTV